MNSTIGSILVALLLLSAPAQAQQSSGSTSSLPSKALILGVPYVSWSEAAQLRYEHKDIVNPSIVAVGKMARKYWGQDRPRFLQFGTEEYLPENWKGSGTPEKAHGLTDLKTWIARGVPVGVQLPLTPHAHPISGAALVAIILKKFKLPDRGPSSEGFGRWAPWETLLQIGLGHNELREVFTAADRLIIGYDDDRKVVIMHDPSFGPAWEMGYDEFESNWRLNEYVHFARPPEGYADFVAKRPASPPYPPRTPDMQAAVHFAFGYGFAEIGWAAEAEREFEKGLALPGVGNGYRHVLALELALHRKASGRLEEAIALLRQAIEALPEAPGPYKLLSQIYRENPSLPGAQQAAVEVEQLWKSRFNTRAGMSVVLRTLPRDFYLPGLTKLRGWACEPDFRNSVC